MYLRRQNITLTTSAMIGSLIGAGISAAGSIFGGIKASQAMKKVKANLKEQRQQNQDWYNRRYNEDATQRADAQAILAKTQESIRDRNKQAAAAQAVAAGTEESVAAAKAATNIAVNGEARKDSIESQYQQTDAALQQQLNDIERGKAANIAQAAQGVGQAGANIAGLF